MLRGTRKYWLIAVVFGLLVAALFYRYLNDMKTAYTPKDLVTVVKARENIPKDTVINANSLVVEEIPAQYVHPDAVRDKTAVVGKVTTSNIAAGEQILNQKMLGASDEEKRLAYAIPQNKRAMSVAIDSVSGVSGNVQRGDMVDVVAVVEVKATGEADPIPYSILVVQNVMVLSIGQNTATNVEKKAQDSTTVTLAVSVEEAQRLALATEKGAIRLLLRSPVDKATTTSPAIGPKEFVR
ncbi:MAG: Flp pilus assembly protein CpaB [Syntrophomonadaceae bacterium]